MDTVYKCRLCLNTTTKKIDIFKHDFPKMIQLLSGLVVSPNDGLLQTSCLDCAKDVKFCMSVRKQILQSHKILTSELLKNSSSELSPHLKPIILNTDPKSVRSSNRTSLLLKKASKTVSPPPRRSPRKKTIKKPIISSPEVSDYEDSNDFSDYNDYDDPEFEPMDIKEKVKIKESSEDEDSGSVLEEITIIPEGESEMGLKIEPLSDAKEEIKDEPIEGSLNVETKIFEDDLKEPLSPSKSSTNAKLLRKRSMLAASNKILSDRRYCNVVFVRKSRRENMEKQKARATEKPKRQRVIDDTNVIIRNGKKYAACEICKREVKKHYMKHHMTTHFPKHFSCDICGATTRNIRGLRYHKLYWHSSKLDYICDKCGKKYRSKHALDLHGKKEHGGVRDLECNICGKKFFQKMHLKRHVDGIHKKLRPHKCEYCGKDFSKRTHLVTHWRTHTNETPYACEMCGERFKLKLSLKNHLKRVHNFEEEQKVFCDVCKRGFASEQGLRAHINSRVHEGQKCQYCSEVFTEEYMKNHLRDVHGVGLFIESMAAYQQNC